MGNCLSSPDYHSSELCNKAWHGKLLPACGSRSACQRKYGISLVGCVNRAEARNYY